MRKERNQRRRGRGRGRFRKDWEVVGRWIRGIQLSRETKK